MKKYIKWSLVIGWMILIFVFSSEPANISNENNHFFIKVLSLAGIDLNSIFGQLADFIVRKCAHFLEYLILYLLVYNAIKERYSLKKSLWAALLIVFLYACTDEFHQLFVPGREGRIRDVMIDTSGGALALVIIYISSIYRKVPTERKTS